jgi:hypothetical protein
MEGYMICKQLHLFSVLTMIQKPIYLIVLFLILFGNAAGDTTKKLAREPFGLQLGMKEESVHRRLQRIATRQKEERNEEEEGGEQEVWVLKNDSRFSYLLTRFDRAHRLMFFTIAARPDARVRYDDLGNIKDAVVTSDGRVYSYKWRVAGRRGQKSRIVIARGSSNEFLTSYSVYFVR